MDFFEAVIRGTEGVCSKQMKYVHNKCVCHAFMKEFIKKRHGDHYDGVLLVRVLQQRRKIKLLTLLTVNSRRLCADLICHKLNGT